MCETLISRLRQSEDELVSVGLKSILELNRPDIANLTLFTCQRLDMVPFIASGIFILDAGTDRKELFAPVQKWFEAVLEVIPTVSSLPTAFVQFQDLKVRLINKDEDDLVDRYCIDWPFGIVTCDYISQVNAQSTNPNVFRVLNQPPTIQSV
jgi:hypothetical protein